MSANDHENLASKTTLPQNDSTQWHLPEGFDPRSGEQLRALSSGQVASELGELVWQVGSGIGDVSDVPFALLGNDEIREGADPNRVVLYRALLREMVRRAVGNPNLGLTQEYLFGEDT